MTNRFSVVACFWLCMVCSAVSAIENPPGLLAQWDFDEGRGKIARDASGNGYKADVFGATWVKQGKGYALSFDGLDDYVDGTATKKLDLTGPISVEAWIKPMAKSQGLAALFGSGLTAYFVGYYAHAELVYWFIGSGGNKLYEKVDFKKWNHIATTFDGERMSLWLNGVEIGNKESKHKTYKSQGGFTIGTKGRPDLPKFRGLIDKVRVYNQALSPENIVEHYKTESPEYGIDPTWFKRLKVTPYFYFDRSEVIVEANYKGLTPFVSHGRIELKLTRKDQPDNIIQHEVIKSLVVRKGTVTFTLHVKDIKPGEYVIQVKMSDGDKKYPVEKCSFSYPNKPAPLASPSKITVAAVPKRAGPTPFKLRMGKNGGFRINIKKKSYPFTTRISWPNGDFNQLNAGSKPTKGEKKWHVRTKSAGRGKFVVEAGGKYYKLRRHIEVFPTHVSIKDEYTNQSKEDLGLLVYNELKINPEKTNESRLGGFKRGGRLKGVFCPSVFVADDNTGLAFLPIDDVYVIQSVIYRDKEGWGVGTEQFALAPGKSYTLEWAIYPTGSGDYYDFINAFRHVEDRIGTIDGGLGFFTVGPKNRDQIPTKEFIEQRGIKYGLMHNLAGIVDDPTLSIQGVEFVDFPKERARLRKQMDAIKAKLPDLKVAIHMAHSLYCTNQTDRYDDSKLINDKGDQATWEVPFAYISEEKQKAGWKFWIFYPTPGNKFHDVMLKSLDVLIDEMHIDGGFMDGFFAGYSGRWTYDGRWDGYSATIDLKTKTIINKVGSVLLLSQPSMIAYTRKMRDKGGFTVANNTVVTRSMANEKYIIHDSESGAGPQLHLAPTITALGSGQGIHSRKDLYMNMLENLRWGELFMYYGGHFDYPWKPLAARQYPMTFEEIRSGLVRGPERIVTMNSGIYSWPDSYQLHLVYKYDSRGVASTHDYITTVDASGVRTQLKFIENESAVIEPVPAELESSQPINTRIIRYDADGLHMLLNAIAMATLQLHDGAMRVSNNQTYEVTVNGTKQTVVAKDATLSIPLNLSGEVDLLIKPAVSQ